MRKGQFFFNYLRGYMGNAKGLDNPYPACHMVFFNISDENWEKMEKDYNDWKSGKDFKFTEKPFGESIISNEHMKAFSESIRELLKDEKIKKLVDDIKDGSV